uniref:Secreted protein n=1 Tax=Arundo donax TaxID=35708 RepID=A0A0A9GDV9_ARUDO
MSFPLFFLLCGSFGFMLLRRSSVNNLLSQGVSKRRGITCIPNLSCILTFSQSNMWSSRTCVSGSLTMNLKCSFHSGFRLFILTDVFFEGSLSPLRRILT